MLRKSLQFSLSNDKVKNNDTIINNSEKNIIQPKNILKNSSNTQSNNILNTSNIYKKKTILKKNILLEDAKSNFTNEEVEYLINIINEKNNNDNLVKNTLSNCKRSSYGESNVELKSKTILEDAYFNKACKSQNVSCKNSNNKFYKDNFNIIISKNYENDDLDIPSKDNYNNDNFKDIEKKTLRTLKKCKSLKHSYNKNNNLNFKTKKNSSSNNSNEDELGNYLFERSNLILKILNYCKEDFRKSEKTYMVKALNWIIGEIQDSLIFKSDDGIVRFIENIKNNSNNNDLNDVFNWLKEYSTIKNIYVDEENSSLNYDSTSKGDNSKIIVQEKNSKKNTSSLILNKLLSTSNINVSINSSLELNDNCLSKIEQPNFNIINYEKEVGYNNVLQSVSCYIFITLGLYNEVNFSNFEKSLYEITNGYKKSNSYHNSIHAADVEQTVFTYLIYGNIHKFLNLSNLDICSILISAIIHDYKHPGRTNQFLINTNDNLAILYNDQSILENYHLAESFKLFNSSSNFNIFSVLSKEHYKLMRKRIVSLVLATDMSYHSKQYQYLKIKEDSYNIKQGTNLENIINKLGSNDLFNTQQEFLNIMLHAADISNPTKPWDIYNKWIDRVMNEFWEQGDEERKLNLPISFLCDRNTTKISNSQLGFIDGIVLPLLTTFIEFFPGLEFLLTNCKNNKEILIKQKDKEESNNKTTKI